MKRPLYVAAFCAVCTWQPLTGCEKPVPEKKAASEHEEKTVTNTDVEGLSRLINLPYAPTSVRWRTEKFEHGGNWGLSALLLLKGEDIDKLMQAAETLPNCRPKVPRQVLATWFPAGARPEVTGAGATANEMVAVDAICIRPTPFTMPEKSPAIHGNALVFGKHGLVFLDLYTM